MIASNLWLREPQIAGLDEREACLAASARMNGSSRSAPTEAESNQRERFLRDGGLADIGSLAWRIVRREILDTGLSFLDIAIWPWNSAWETDAESASLECNSSREYLVGSIRSLRRGFLRETIVPIPGRSGRCPEITGTRARSNLRETFFNEKQNLRIVLLKSCLAFFVGRVGGSTTVNQRSMRRRQS